MEVGDCGEIWRPLAWVELACGRLLARGEKSSTD